MASPSEIHEHFKKGECNMNEKIEFTEYKSPEYWLKRRARRAFIENVGPVLIVLGIIAAFAIMGSIQGTI